MKKSKVLALMLALLVSTSLVLSACGAGTAAAPETESPKQEASNETQAKAGESAAPADAGTEKTELTFITCSGVLYDAAKYAADTFNEMNDDVSVSIVETSADTYYSDGYQVLTADGGMYDMCFYWNNTIWPEMANNGVFLPLDDIYESEGWIDAIGQSTADLYKGSDGHYYSLPDNFVWIGNVYYNADVFKELGLSVPKTMDELYSISATLKDNGYIPLAVSAQSGYAEHIFDPLVVRSAGTDKYNMLRNQDYSSFDYTSSEMMPVYENIYKFGDEVIQEGAATVNQSEAETLFTTGKAAMLTETSSGASMYPGYNLDFEVGYFALPELKAGDNSPICTYAGNCVSICSNTAYPDECKRFLTHYFSSDVQSYITNQGWLTSTRNDIDTSGLNSLYKAMYADMESKGTIPMWCFGAGAEVQATLEEVVESLYARVMTPEDAATMMQDAADRDLQ